ncbi:uncharacterized protein (DUF1778 family) [Volucribacter psittacicida]|uniref:Uncharacterized protein (DUF1778 family) n=1 Tax=Volucribacter psittacicida TaxID=203482 RepID=A0A4R1G7T6_9PAST|nr:DUF1778 domain-containing protein [Volucribacter psittacicida]TCK01729.1 uncharacterized protein (DUF1778 family) [Volucribacter psittacicida]
MRTVAISLRVQPMQRDLIDRSASLLGKTRSDFMLDVVCYYAQNVILERTLFQLDEQEFQRFIQTLEQPNLPNTGIEKLMAVNSPWKSDSRFNLKYSAKYP